MKVALVDLNSMEITGESTYLIHMKPSLEKLGYQVEIVTSSASGRKGKWKCNYPATWLKDKNVLEYLKQFDIIHVNNGRFGDKEYSFLKGIDQIGKIRTLQVHGVTQASGYSMPVLIDIVKPHAMFNVDPNGVEYYKQFHNDITWVELPFCPEIMPLGHRVPPQKRIVNPCRFTFIKYPGEIIKLLKILQNQGFVLDFYGYESFVSNAQGFREELEGLEKSGQVRLNPIFQHEDKFRVYNGAMFMMDATRIKNMGPNRIQYATLEAMFYGVIPIINEEWHHQHIRALKFDLTDIQRAINNLQYRNEIKQANYLNLVHYRGEEVCRVHSDVWKRLS